MKVTLKRIIDFAKIFLSPLFDEDAKIIVRMANYDKLGEDIMKFYKILCWSGLKTGDRAIEARGLRGNGGGDNQLEGRAGHGWH